VCSNEGGGGGGVTYRYRAVHWLHIGLFHKYLLDLALQSRS